MTEQHPETILNNAYLKALELIRKKRVPHHLSKLPTKCVEQIRLIVNHAESQKAVLGVTLTSIAYKIYQPTQDIRYHQERLKGGYSGRTFDTKYTTPFLQDKFPHLAMAESSWLTRSLEQPHPFTLDFPGRIRNPLLKTSFLELLDYLEQNASIAQNLIVALMVLLIETSGEYDLLSQAVTVSEDLIIARIVEAVHQHISRSYSTRSGVARIPVVAIYSVYQLLVRDVRRYQGKELMPLTSHTTADLRSKSLGDIEILEKSGDCFEAIEVKHLIPVSVNIVNRVYHKIKNKRVNRYYILTTHEPNWDDVEEVFARVKAVRAASGCQIIVNGVIPSLKYYLRMVNDPNEFLEAYTTCLQTEFSSASGIKKEHLEAWLELQREYLIES